MIGNDIEIIISAVDGEQVKIGINAPSSINILRKEIFETVQQSNLEAVTGKFNLQKLRKIQK